MSTPADKLAAAKAEVERLKLMMLAAAVPAQRARLEQDLHRARVTLRFAQHRMRWAAWKNAEAGQ